MFMTNRFLPLFKTQALGAFNDNMLKNAMVMLLTYRVATVPGQSMPELVALAGSLLILPSLLFSALAGQIADKYDRAATTRIIKTYEIGIMLVATLGFIANSLPMLFVCLLGMGIHSAFFGPIKLALLPQHLRADELVRGNAYVEAGTFLAILLGTLLGGVLVLLPGGAYVVAGALLSVALTGYLASRDIPAAPAPDAALSVNWNVLSESLALLRYARQDRNIWLCLLGIAWFWLVGATLLAELAPFVKLDLHAQASVVTLLLAVFSVGIGAGALLGATLMRGRIQMTYVPLAILAISLFGIDLFFATRHVPTPAGCQLSLFGFLHHVTDWRVMGDFFMMALAGGIYVVPLNAQIQHRGAPSHMARLIAAGNILAALFMVGAALAVMALLYVLSIPQIFLLLAMLNFAVAVYVCRLLPDALLRSGLRMVLGLLFRVEISGLEHFTSAGPRVLLVANHTSFLDAALLAAYLPERMHFAVNTFIARRWWLRPLLRVVDAFPVDPTNPLATKSLIDLLKQDKKCIIFPEGRITVTGGLMKIYEGPGMIADKSGAALLPVRIDGAQYTVFSRLKGKVRLRWFPKITLTVLPAQNFGLDPEVKGRARRQLAAARLYDAMSDMVFASTPHRQTLFLALLGAQEVHGRKQVIAEDIERKPLTYGGFVTRSFILGRTLARRFPNEHRFGVLLPNAVTTAVTFFALHARGRIPAMLNFTAGGATMVAACQTAEVKTVLTSRRFVTMGKLEAAIAALETAAITVFYLEDVAPLVGRLDKLHGFIASYVPRLVYRRTAAATSPDAPAVILYTSGSEGTPKGVVLSHANITANCAQLASRIDFGPTDSVFNILPMFHAFGLTGGTLLPIFSGIKTFYYPSPLHYRIIPELIYDTGATILFGTDTFMSAYARFANAYDFRSLRYVFAGAEKLKEETRRIYADKYGVRVLEGYGATETSPVISMGTPLQNRPGTVGRLLPGMEYQLREVPGISHGGQLWVKGPNVMLGYFKAEAPGHLQPPADGWYDTGDIVAIDADGYISIQGRTKRFAKIGGEMVSLTAVESAVAKLWPQYRHVVVSVPDAKKGEHIVLLSEYAEADDRSALLRHFQAEQLPELAIPRRIIVVYALPWLGTGKADYQQAKALALAA